MSARTLALPFHAELTEGEVDRVVAALLAAV
jgi:dTDP-4-amino-4,6-dideoxygalactose transaminase